MHLKSIYVLLILPLWSYSQSTPYQYIDADKPLLKAKIFAPGVISKENRYEFGSVFNANVDEFFFAVDSNGRADIRYSKLENGKWTTPAIIISDEGYGLNDPFLSPDETKLFYISNKPRSERNSKQNYDIWYSNRTPTGWSGPINAGDEINSDANEYYVSFTKDGSMYFSSNKNEDNFDIYKSKFINGKLQTPERLSDAVNTNQYEADVFVAPDESYLIFCSRRKEGFGRGDLYISFKEKSGEWSEAVNMGTIINTKGHELCPFVTADGKYFFYTSNQDIYWISTEIFNKLKVGE